MIHYKIVGKGLQKRMESCREALSIVNQCNSKAIIVCENENAKQQVLDCLDYLQKLNDTKLRYPGIEVKRR